MSLSEVSNETERNPILDFKKRALFKSTTLCLWQICFRIKPQSFSNNHRSVVTVTAYHVRSLVSSWADINLTLGCTWGHI